MANDFTPLLAALSNLGAFGVLIAFLIWKDVRGERQREKMEQDHRTEKLLLEERQIARDKDVAEANRTLAGALAGLTAVVQARPSR